MTCPTELDRAQTADVLRAFRHAASAARLVGDSDPLEEYSTKILLGLAHEDLARAARAMLELVDDFEPIIEDTMKHSDTDESTDAAALTELANARRALRD